MQVRLVGVEGAVMVLSVRVSAELLAVMVALGTTRNCCPASPLALLSTLQDSRRRTLASILFLNA